MRRTIIAGLAAASGVEHLGRGQSSTERSMLPLVPVAHWYAESPKSIRAQLMR